MSFIDDRLDLLERQRRAGDERRIGLPHMHGAGKILSRIDLDPVNAMQFCLTHGRARQPRTVDVLVLDEAFEESYRLIVRIVVRRALIEGLPDDLHSRPLDETGV